ncbi:MAG: CvpA family protein [Firmicutes bacterium]|nr:CvpA family protein [Bacillota bacterium]MBQ2041708.1 CvpA family protein [Bacillota bacterium]
MSTGLIIDIVLIVLAVAAIVAGAIRGLFKTVLAVVMTVVAIVASVVLSGILAGPVTDMVYPRYEEKLMKLVTEPSLHINIGAILSDATENTIGGFMEMTVPEDFFVSGLPGEVLKIANQFGFTEEDLRKPVENALKSAQDVMRNYLEKQKAAGKEVDKASAADAVEEANKAAAKAFLRPIVRAVLIIVLFIILSILLKLIAGALNRAAKKTQGVKQVNSVGGAILSFAEYVVIVYILLYFAHRFGITTSLDEVISDSTILSFLLRFVPA